VDVLDLVENGRQHADEDRADVRLLVLQERHRLVLENDPAVGGSREMPTSLKKPLRTPMIG
jgi:hypothetical protein